MLATSKASIIDMQTLLKDSAAVTSSAGAQVGGVAKILDMGASVAPTAGMDEACDFIGEVDIDVTALTTGGDHRFQILIQGSSSSTFASDVVNLGMVDLSTQTPMGGGIVGATGRYKVHITNRFNNNARRYIRAYTLMSGTGGPSITYTASLSKARKLSA